MNRTLSIASVVVLLVTAGVGMVYSGKTTAKSAGPPSEAGTVPAIPAAAPVPVATPRPEAAEPAIPEAGVPVPVASPTAERVGVAPSQGAPRSQAPTTDAGASWGPPAAPNIDPRRFTEAHWQGLEVIPNTPLVAQAINLPPNTAGVIVDDVTLPADLQGFQAGDVITSVGRTPTADLMAFIHASSRLRDQTTAQIELVRNGQTRVLPLVALGDRLGTANGETPSMIPPGARMPHPYRGPCTNCHRIGTTGTLPVDQGDLVITTAPAIAAGSIRPHRDRGPCTACHQILP